MKYFLILLLLLMAALIISLILKRLSRKPAEPGHCEPVHRLISAARTDELIPLPEPSVQAGPNESGDRQRPFSILIVDDQAAIRMLLCEMFELEGLQVYEACNGRMAIEQVRQNKIDFILMDVKMPDMDGFTALTEIRSFNSEVRVAMITAYGDSDKLDQAKQLGTLAFFTKPFDIEIVKSFVLRNLGS